MIDQPRWRKSSFSGTEGNCVELADLGNGFVGLRDSKDPDGGELRLTRHQLADLVAAVNAGDYDDLLS